MSHVVIPTQATQVTYPWKAAVRTAVQAFLSFAALFAVASPILVPFLSEYLPAEWVAYVVGFGVFVAGLSAVVARIMALPQLQSFLGSIGLAAVPKDQLS